MLGDHHSSPHRWVYSYSKGAEALGIFLSPTPHTQFHHSVQIGFLSSIPLERDRAKAQEVEIFQSTT